ncbi:MAG TPA: 3-hydroxybutyryl-CoA dehydrogenase [Thermomicrobiales bacterium]|nr:3-hydroxybutyryl-CoA dehydrogenase [Thermomicrobiales bacterium]
MTQGNRIGIIGAGTMGAGIAQVAAASGFEVALIDTKDEFVASGLQRIESGLQRLVGRERMSGEERDATLGRITTGTSMETLAGSELVIEAVVESFDTKVEVLRQVADVVDKTTILATNTSSISITALAATVPNPERFAGMHFFNPVPVLKLVEVVRGLQTSDATAATIREVAEQMGKTPAEVADMPGFAANRILIPMINEAIFAVAEGVASAEEIDMVMTLGASHPLGPLALADLIGLDVCLHIMEVLHKDFGDDKYRPAPLLRQMVSAGRLGRKSGQGFHSYENPQS